MTTEPVEYNVEDVKEDYDDVMSTTTELIEYDVEEKDSIFGMIEYMKKIMISQQHEHLVERFNFILDKNDEWIDIYINKNISIIYNLIHDSLRVTRHRNIILNSSIRDDLLLYNNIVNKYNNDNIKMEPLRYTVQDVVLIYINCKNENNNS